MNGATTYTVNWSPPSANGHDSKSDISDPTTTITGLQSNTEYIFTVSAINKDVGVSSQPSDGTTTVTCKKSIS